MSTLFGKPKSQVIRHPGAVKRAAVRAKETTHQWEEQHRGDPGRKGKEARLGLTLSKMRR